MTSPEPLYVCGYSRHELQRLITQGTFFEEISRRFLEAAGLASGMRVLDIGCGAGDLSLVAADLVGTSGFVLGIDRAAEPLELAAARARSKGIRNVEFRHAEITELEPDSPVDALIGRFVLMHQGEPARVLRTAASHVGPGGIVAFLESHMAGLLPGLHS
ncbi:MAG: class I SAM-dependent methyltransferase, partial [Gemmatimonadota bacterium]